MNFRKRALRYLVRKSSKTVILFMVLLIAETMILCTVTILRASEEAKSSLQEKTKAKVIAEISDEKDLITQNDVDSLSKISGVKSLNRVTKVQTYPVDFQVVKSSNDASEDNKKLKLTSYDDLEADGLFADGQLKLIEGSYPQKKNEIVVNQILASINQWQINDEVAFANTDGGHIVLSSKLEAPVPCSLFYPKLVT